MATVLEYGRYSEPIHVASGHSITTDYKGIRLKSRPKYKPRYVTAWAIIEDCNGTIKLVIGQEKMLLSLGCKPAEKRAWRMGSAYARQLEWYVNAFKTIKEEDMKIGDRVQTVKAGNVPALSNQKFGVYGRITSNPCVSLMVFRVKHDDGTTADYTRNELVVVPGPIAFTVEEAQHLLRWAQGYADGRLSTGILDTNLKAKLQSHFNL